ncbi:MAG: hypothetical protein QW687_06265 [Candidatus Hadarchaeales archaeon]
MILFVVGVMFLGEKRSKKAFTKGRRERLVKSKSNRRTMPMETCFFEYGCGVKGGRRSNGRRGRSSSRKERKR